MPMDTATPRLKRKASNAIFPAIIVMIALGGVGIYLLGKEDPKDPATQKLSWGDRFEKRMDAFIDRVRPEWTDRVETHVDAAASKVGWK